MSLGTLDSLIGLFEAMFLEDPYEPEQQEEIVDLDRPVSLSRPDTFYNKFDSMDRDFETDVYKELKMLRFKGVLSKDEYKRLYDYQKAIDEKEALINDIKTRDFRSPAQAISRLKFYKSRIEKFHDKSYVTDENYENICDIIDRKINEINRTGKIQSEL